ncbi:MAG: molybdopterin synthase sulfur carrier subunit [Gammaproteobacteria bacterium HGW-Gammaproteobacteria-14]|nr:MAG: molybdopterin synthase sulfur carrier subunit [Gammaproteobacteria bacterium HGW-Gammaproteobacteria-14]
MVEIRYFARLRERLGCEHEELVHPGGVFPIASLCALLAERGGIWAEEFAGQRPIMAAINEQLESLQAPIQDGDVVALFPPVTGG